MKKKLLNVLLVIILLVAIPGTLLLASDISGALYRMSITVSNNGTLVNYVSTNTVVSTNSGWISTPNLIAGGFLNASANNCAVLDAADNDVTFMPGYSTNPWVFWVETIGADSYINYDLYTADTTGGSIAYFPDITGMIVSDNSTIEPGSDFEVEVEGWVDTTVSANASLVFKDDAFRTWVNATEEISSAIYGWISPTSFTDVGNDWATEPLAYDGNTVTLSTCNPPGIGYSDWLTLPPAVVVEGCSKVRYWHTRDNADINLIKVEVFYSGGWVNIFTGDPTAGGAWIEKTIPAGPQTVSDARIAFNDSTGATLAYLHEFEYFGIDDEVTATGISSGEYTVTTYGVANEPAWATGDVLHFTGANTSNVNATAINDNIPNLWVGLWFRLDSTFSAASATDQFIWGKYIDATHYVYAYLESDDGKLYYEFDDGGVNPFSLASTTVSWTGGVWYYIINSLDNTPVQRLLVNGVAEDTDTVAASNTPNGGDFCFGDFDDPGAVTGFIGEIQNVVIGTDILLVAEEAALYAGTAPGDETDYWYADEGTGTVITSYGSAANVGTADTACTWETSTYTTGKTGRWCDFYIEVDDGVTDPDRWGANLKGASVPPNGNDWEFFLNDAMPYVYRDEITVGGVLHAWHEWEYDTTFHDRSYYGLDFDGVNDRVQVTDAAEIRNLPAYSWEFWMYLEDWGGGGFGRCIWKTANLYCTVSTTNDNFAAVRTAAGVNAISYSAINSIVLDTWYHIVVTYDDAGDRNTHIYIDGTEAIYDSQSTATLALSDDTGDLYIGNLAALNRAFDGIIDGIKFYDRVITGDEITYGYNAGVGNYTPYSTSGLVAEWHIEEGSGAVLTDTSGEGNNGAITGATWTNGKVPRPAGSPGTNDATPSFRTASSDVDVVATAVSFQPIEEAKAPAWSLSTDTATWYSASNITGNFTTTPTPTFPGASVIADIAAATGTPAQLPFTILYGFIILAVSLSLSSVLRRYGSRSLLVKIVVIGGMLGIGEALGVIDFWMLLFFLIMAITFMAASKPGEVV